MKAFFGALVLSLVSAIVGIFASTELHEMTLAAGGSSAVIRATTAETALPLDSQQIKQKVNDSAQGAVKHAQPVADDI